MKRYFVLLFFTIILIFAGINMASGVDGHWPTTGSPPAAPERTVLKTTLSSENGVFIYFPLVTRPPEPPPWVDTQDREMVKQFYLIEYLASEGVDGHWTGNIANCIQGTTSNAFQEAILRRINFFRAMVGIPAVEAFKADYNRKAQAAALMMSANRQLSHTPDSSWKCYSEDGRQGAGSSNLFLGVYGPAAISGYIHDPGDGNYFVGHRRWILYPQSRFLGTGDIPSADFYSRANALWVFDNDNIWGPRPETREGFVAWPPSGYVPYMVVYPKWSFAYPDADFNGVSVTMTRNGNPVAVVVHTLEYGFGENTLVWEPATDFTKAPGSDTFFTVTLSGVVIDGADRDFEYTVILFDPDA